jgi:hypothetical protein
MPRESRKPLDSNRELETPETMMSTGSRKGNQVTQFDCSSTSPSPQRINFLVSLFPHFSCARIARALVSLVVCQSSRGFRFFVQLISTQPIVWRYCYDGLPIQVWHIGRSQPDSTPTLGTSQATSGGGGCQPGGVRVSSSYCSANPNLWVLVSG